MKTATTTIGIMLALFGAILFFLDHPSNQYSELPITLYVDYNPSVEQLISKGIYDNVSNEITSANFKKEKETSKDTIQAFLLHLGSISSENAILFMEKHSPKLRPATLKELEALNIQTPYLQREFWIVALGSNFKPTNSTCKVPCLGYSFKSSWLLLQHNWEDDWEGSYWFLAVPQ
jgi:hypothetical protein